MTLESFEGRLVSKHESETWYFRFARFGWAYYTICEDLGTFSIESDWGSWSFTWPAAGRGDRKMREFIMSADADYIVRKFAMNEQTSFRYCFSLIETCKALRKVICEDRREQFITKERAAELWAAVEEAEEQADEWEGDVAAARFYDRLPEVLDRYFENVHELMVYEVSDEFRAARDRVVPFFQRFLREQEEARRALEEKPARAT